MSTSKFYREVCAAWFLRKYVEQVVRNVMIVDAFAHSRLNRGSVGNPGTITTDAESRKNRKL